MIYDDKTLETCSDEVLSEHETKLLTIFQFNYDQWLTTKTVNSNDEWAFKVECDVKCLKQVRKHILKRK